MCLHTRKLLTILVRRLILYLVPLLEIKRHSCIRLIAMKKSSNNVELLLMTRGICQTTCSEEYRFSKF